MAREIARRLQADILRIETKPYGLDFKGWLQANSDAASEKKQVDITPEVVDLHPYRLIFWDPQFGGIVRRRPCGLLLKRTISAEKMLFYSTPSTANSKLSP